MSRIQADFHHQGLIIPGDRLEEMRNALFFDPNPPAALLPLRSLLKDNPEAQDSIRQGEKVTIARNYLIWFSTLGTDYVYVLYDLDEPAIAQALQLRRLLIDVNLTCSGIPLDELVAFLGCIQPDLPEVSDGLLSARPIPGESGCYHPPVKLWQTEHFIVSLHAKQDYEVEIKRHEGAAPPEQAEAMIALANQLVESFPAS